MGFKGNNLLIDLAHHQQEIELLRTSPKFGHPLFIKLCRSKIVR